MEAKGEDMKMGKSRGEEEGMSISKQSMTRRTSL